MSHILPVILSTFLHASPTSNPGAATTIADGGRGTVSAAADPSDEDAAMRELRRRECEDHLKRAEAFEVRASLERQIASREEKPAVKKQLLLEAERLSSLARKERELGAPAAL
jgi:hypothetical protein